MLVGVVSPLESRYKCMATGVFQFLLLGATEVVACRGGDSRGMVINIGAILRAAHFGGEEGD
jgi:hypothetical protein